VAHVQQQSERRRLEPGDLRDLGGQRHFEGIANRTRRHDQRNALRGAHYQRLAVEQRDELPRHGGHQLRLAVDSLGLQSCGAQLGEPAIDARMFDHRDLNPAGFGGAGADGEVQILDLVGDTLFERKGNDLCELGRILGRRVALGDEYLAGRDDDRDAATD
jgi:hypothetical protein